MDSAPKPASKALSERLVSSALDIVTDGGLESLTMRRLADALNVKLPTIYRHFASKGALLDAMADSIMANALIARDESEWPDRATALAMDLRRALLDQRDGAHIVGGRYTAKKHTLAFADALVETMQSSGLSGADALWATTAIFSYVLGETLEEQGLSDEDTASLLDGSIERQRYPHLFATPAAQLVDFDERFAFGVGVFIGGLERLVASRS